MEFVIDGTSHYPSAFRSNAVLVTSLGVVAPTISKRTRSSALVQFRMLLLIQSHWLVLKLMMLIQYVLM